VYVFIVNVCLRMVCLYVFINVCISLFFACVVNVCLRIVCLYVFIVNVCMKIICLYVNIINVCLRVYFACVVNVLLEGSLPVFTLYCTVVQCTP